MAAPTRPSIDERAAVPTIWPKALTVAAGLVAAVDVVFFAMIGEVIPPLAAGVVLTIVGVVLLPRRPRAGIGVLGIASLLLLLLGAPFAVGHLAHPESGVDFTHAVVGTLGRVLVIALAVGAWRGASERLGRRLATVGAALLALTVAVALIATVATGGQTAEEHDVDAVIENGHFPEETQVPAAGTIFVDNTDLFRHTYTVPGTGIDVELPARQGTRIGVDLEPGSYEVICDVPGHEYMASTLIVAP